MAPFFTSLSQSDGLATLAFGVTHPSLANYLALLAGDYLGVHNDNPSCYAQPPVHPCYGFNKTNLVDSLEAAGISWNSYNQSMPSDGFLGQQYPNKGDGLYRQKHDPFPYFKDIATNATRIKHIKTFDDLFFTINNGVLPIFIHRPRRVSRYARIDCPTVRARTVSSKKGIARRNSLSMRSSVRARSPTGR